MNFKGKKVLVVAHDAGGAEVLSHFIKSELDLEYLTFLLSGPAVNIFNKNLGKFNIANNLGMALRRSQTLLTATSWESDIEYAAINLANKNQIENYAMLDHWVNYKHRFIRNNIETLPSNIIVLDGHAKSLAKKEWPNQNVIEIPNYYLNDQLYRYTQKIGAKSGRVDDNTILYLWDPSLKHKERLKLENEVADHSEFYDEKDAFSLFLSKITSIPGDPSKIRVRFHPSMTKDDKEKACSYIGIKFEISAAELTDDLLECTSVVGCNSMAMAIALKVGKKVFSSLPNSNYPILIPFKAIILLHLI